MLVQRVNRRDEDIVVWALIESSVSGSAYPINELEYLAFKSERVVLRHRTEQCVTRTERLDARERDRAGIVGSKWELIRTLRYDVVHLATQLVESVPHP